MLMTTTPSAPPSLIALGEDPAARSHRVEQFTSLLGLSRISTRLCRKLKVFAATLINLVGGSFSLVNVRISIRHFRGISIPGVHF